MAISLRRRSSLAMDNAAQALQLRGAGAFSSVGYAIGGSAAHARYPLLRRRTNHEEWQTSCQMTQQ